MTKQIAYVLSLSFLLGTGFVGYQFSRIANSFEYGTAQAKKFEPIVDVVSDAAARKAATLSTLLQQKGR